jgi:hypothetical protein
MSQAKLTPISSVYRSIHSGLRAAVKLVRGRQTGRVDQRVIDALSPLGATNIDMPATSQKVWQAIQDAAA